MLVTAFIAYRLNRQETAYALLLSRIEESRAGWLAGPAIGGISARAMMPVVLALAGIALVVLGLRF